MGCLVCVWVCPVVCGGGRGEVRETGALDDDDDDEGEHRGGARGTGKNLPPPLRG